MGTVVIGIDPGLSGAVAIINDDGFTNVHDMPVVAYSKTGFVKRVVDLNGLRQRLSGLISAAAFIERVNAFPGQGVGSMFSLGMSYWGAAGVVAGLGLPLNLVSPQEWKGHFHLNKDKELARGLASRLFPQIDLSRVKDHGRAEALLIAKYGLDKLKGLT